MIKQNCINTIHALRLPSKLESTGMLTKSMAGAHKNLKEYGNPISDARPIVVLSTPTSVNHIVSVEPVSSNGIPQEMPSISIESIRGLKYTNKLDSLLLMHHLLK